MEKIFFKAALVILFLINLNLSAQTKIDYNDLENYIENARSSFEVPGMAVGIVKNGEIVMNRGFGFGNNKSKKPVDKETVFGIASCTKAFTAACMAILVDEGKLNWSDKVIDHLPGFQLYDPYITRELRIDDLLCHRSGLMTFDGDLLWYGSDYDREEIIRRIRFRANEYGFRESYGYQNIMFIVAGEVIEQISSKSWDEFVAENIFQPLGMISSTTTNKGFTEEMNIALPHIDGEIIEILNYDNCGPAASINTSSTDLLNWVTLMLYKGIFDGDTVFSAQQYYKLTQPHTLLRSGAAETINDTHFYTYGLGWFMYDYQGRKVIEHGGGLPGFHSKVVFIPEDSLGYVIMANQLSGLVEAVHKRILDTYLAKPETDWAALYLEYTRKKKEREKLKAKEKYDQRKTGTKPSLNLGQYTGIYEDKMYGEAEVSIINDQLYVKLLPSQQLFSALLNHWHYDTFSFSFKDEFLPEGYITFVINGNGDVDYFTIDLENPDFHFYKLKFIKAKQ